MDILSKDEFWVRKGDDFFFKKKDSIWRFECGNCVSLTYDNVSDKKGNLG